MPTASAAASMPLQRPRQRQPQPTPRPLRRAHRLPATPLPTQTSEDRLPPPPPLLLPLLLPLAQTVGHHSQNAPPPNGKGGGRPQGPPAATGRGGRRPRRGHHGGLGRSRGHRVQWTTPPTMADGPSPPTHPQRVWRARQGGWQTPPQGEGPMGGNPPSSWQAECGGGRRGEGERETTQGLPRPASGARRRQARRRDAAKGGGGHAAPQ